MRLDPRFFSVTSLLLGLGFAACATPPPRPDTGPLILISLDGFRWDYLEKFPAPTLCRLADEGVQAARLIPCFPSKTFPNHYTLFTGLRPEHHGIVSNYFFDPALNAIFDKAKPADNADARWWAQGEPIWVTAKKQGQRSACFFGPGTTAAVQGWRPDYYKPYRGRIISNDNVDDLLAHLDRPPAARPQFCELYLDIVDIEGHKFGPDARETGLAVQEADAAIARLLAGLTARHLLATTNLVIVSDHGMTPVNAQQVIFLEDLMPLSTVQVESYGPTGGVRPLKGTATELVAQLRAKQVPHLQVYLREDVPAHLHYRDNPRIPPVVLIADEGWNIEPRLGWPYRQRGYERGGHGYDPALPSMGALFIAHGPAFLRGVTLPPVENIHVYNLLCAVLGVTPAPNDGDQRLCAATLQR